MNLEQIGKQAKQAARAMAQTSSAARSEALQAIAGEIERSQETILQENVADVAEAKARGLSPAMVDRLLLNPARIAGHCGRFALCGGAARPGGRGDGAIGAAQRFAGA